MVLLDKNPKNWDTHLDNQGWRGCCKFPKLFTLYFQLYSQNFSEKSILSILTLPPKEIFQLFLLKKSLTLETTDRTVGLESEWKICWKYGKMFWAEQTISVSPFGQLSYVFSPCQASGLRVWVMWTTLPKFKTWLCHLLALCPWTSHSTSLWLFIDLQNKDNNSISVQIYKVLRTVPLAYSRHFFFEHQLSLLLLNFNDNYGSLMGATGWKTHQ